MTAADYNADPRAYVDARIIAAFAANGYRVSSTLFDPTTDVWHVLADDASGARQCFVHTVVSDDDGSMSFADVCAVVDPIIVTLWDE